MTTLKDVEKAAVNNIRWACKDFDEKLIGFSEFAGIIRNNLNARDDYLRQNW